MDPESLKKQEIMDSWMELLDNGSPELAAIAKHVLQGNMPGYNLDELLEDLEGDDQAETEEKDFADEFASNPEVVCLDATGMEEYFDEGVTYVARYLDKEFSWIYDRNGVEREVLTERFKEVREDKPAFEFKKFEPGTEIKITGEPMEYRKHYS